MITTKHTRYTKGNGEGNGGRDESRPYTWAP
jgi:hypothetical protein